MQALGCTCKVALNKGWRTSISAGIRVMCTFKGFTALTNKCNTLLKVVLIKFWHLSNCCCVAVVLFFAWKNIALIKHRGMLPFMSSLNEDLATTCTYQGIELIGAALIKGLHLLGLHLARSEYLYKRQTYSYMSWLLHLHKNISWFRNVMESQGPFKTMYQAYLYWKKTYTGILWTETSVYSGALNPHCWIKLLSIPRNWDWHFHGIAFSNSNGMVSWLKLPVFGPVIPAKCSAKSTHSPNKCATNKISH